jgi:short-subunit dehydrogenase
VTKAVHSWGTVWVTGSSSGLGYELAKLLSDEAEHVAVSARSVDRLNNLAENFTNIMPFPVDVTDAAGVVACVDKVESDCGPIGLAVLNAGTWRMMDAAEFDLRAIRQGIEVNYMGIINALHVVLPRMLSRGHGHISITASVSGYRGLPGAIAYGPTKAALINLAETLRLELAPHGIVVSLVNPGFVDTPMTQENRFPMPGLMPAKLAAKKMLVGLKRRQFEIVFPFSFVSAMKLLRLLPNAGYFWVVRRFVMKK